MPRTDVNRVDAIVILSSLRRVPLQNGQNKHSDRVQFIYKYTKYESHVSYINSTLIE